MAASSALEKKIPVFVISKSVKSNKRKRTNYGDKQGLQIKRRSKVYQSFTRTSKFIFIRQCMTEYYK